MTDAIEQNPFNYPTFNDFFIRKLRFGTRSIEEGEKNIISPVDGKVWQIGRVDNGTLIHAKGKGFSLEQLLASREDADKFNNANFAVLYLAPYNYHRIHMPIRGRLNSMRYIPGQLFSVNPKVVNDIPDVFAKNERVASVFDTSCGQMAAVFVGAMIVGSIDTIWHGVVAPNKAKEVMHWDYYKDGREFNSGDEIGHFKLGSTVILLFPENSMKWDVKLEQGSVIRMGQKIGTVL